MKNNYHTAFLLFAINAIHGLPNNNGVELIDLIAFVYLLNNTIMNYDEFRNGINCLLKYRLIKETDKTIFIEETVKEWFSNDYKNCKRIESLSAVIKRIKKYIEKLEKENNRNENIKSKINGTDFENAVKEYINKNGIKSNGVRG
jgi:hypothetical protein